MIYRVVGEAVGLALMNDEKGSEAEGDEAAAAAATSERTREREEVAEASMSGMHAATRCIIISTVSCLLYTSPSPRD